MKHLFTDCDTIREVIDGAQTHLAEHHWSIDSVRDLDQVTTVCDPDDDEYQIADAALKRISEIETTALDKADKYAERIRIGLLHELLKASHALAQPLAKPVDSPFEALSDLVLFALDESEDQLNRIDNAITGETDHV